MVKILWIIFVLLFGFGVLMETSINAFATEEAENISEESTKEVTGEIILVNPVKSKIVVKYVTDNKEQTTQRLVFNIDEVSLIEKSEKEINISELKEGDKVSVQYKLGEKGKKIIILITVEDKNPKGEEEKDNRFDYNYSQIEEEKE